MIWRPGLAVLNNGSIGVAYGSEFMSVYYEVSTLLAACKKGARGFP